MSVLRYLRETSDMWDIPLADRKTAGELMKQLAKEKFQKKELVGRDGVFESGIPLCWRYTFALLSRAQELRE